ISSFRREAGTSTFWCRAWSAFRTRVNMSATGSVNLIVCFSSSHPFAPRPAENLQRLPTSSCCCLLSGHPSHDFRPAKDLYTSSAFADKPVTRTTSKPLESPRAVLTGGSTTGKCRTCAGTRAAVHTVCSGYACAWKTSALALCCRAPSETFLESWRPSLVLLSSFNPQTTLVVESWPLNTRMLQLCPEWHAHVLQQRPCLIIVRCRRDNRDVHAFQLVHLLVRNLGKDQLVVQTDGVVAASIK